jgi:transcription-repair coupling factor (superfamily II helicase)
MILNGLLEAVRALPEYPGLLEHLSAGANRPRIVALRLPRAARAPVAAAVTQSLGRVALYVVARADRAAVVAEELAAWAPDARVLSFGEPNPLFYEYAAWGPRTIVSRLSVLGELAAPAPELPPAVVVVSARALMWRTLPRRDYLANTRAIKVGQALRIEKALESWVAAG